MTENRNYKMVVAIAISLIMVLSATAIMASATPDHGLSAKSASTVSSTPWTYPTTTQQEPGYTNGSYIAATTQNVEYINIWEASDVYSFALLGEVYDSADAITPNGTIVPWLATNWNEYNISSYTPANATSTFLGLSGNGNLTTFDPITGSFQPVKYIYQVNIRQGVQWTDFSSPSSTYTYSNSTDFNNVTGVPEHYTYRFPSMKMSTYYVQSADFIVSWEIMLSSLDYSSEFASIVNVVPVNNTTVDYYLSQQSASFVTITLGAPILPYHIWVGEGHGYASTSPSWNYNASLPSTNAYNEWNMGYNPTTGQAPGLVGTGPFMFSNNYGEPQGSWIYDKYWIMYVNPHYFVQYTKDYREWTPKFYSLEMEHFLSISAAVTAVTLNQVDTEYDGVPPSFLPTLATSPNTYLEEISGGGFNFIGLNSFNASESSYYASNYGFTPISINPALSQTSVRQALWYATDNAYVDSVIQEGYVTPGTSQLPPTETIWVNSTLPSYSYNPSLAMSLLNSTPGMTYKNGEYYYDGSQFTMNIQTTPASETPQADEGLQVIAQEWSAIGVKTTVTEEAFNTLVANLIGVGGQAYALGITGFVGDPTGWYQEAYNTLGVGTGFFNGPFSNLTWDGQNLTGLQVTSLLNNLTDQINVITNLTQRIAISDEIQGIIAAEANWIVTGYGVQIQPMVTSQFVNATNTSLPFEDYYYWSFDSMHLKTTSTTTQPTPSQTPEQLSIALVPNKRVYYDGQYGNITISVRNQYGAPVSGATVTVGVVPAGGLINISSISGTTNSNGIYNFEFQVFNGNPLIYTADYVSQINITASATILGSSLKVIPTIGYTNIDLSPVPVAYKILKMPSLSNTSSAYQLAEIEIYNPSTGDPVSGYGYSVQVNNAILSINNMGNPSAKTSTLTQGLLTSSTDAYSFNGNYNITQLSGSTGANGTFSFGVKVATGVNSSSLSKGLLSYIFFGNYYAGAPVTGEIPYQTIGEQTNSTSSIGFGGLQPVEIPVQLTQSTAPYQISITSSTPNISAPNGTASVTVKVTNSRTGGPAQNFTVDIVAQNALGANRGFFSGNGMAIEYPDPNALFGTTVLPGIEVVTNSTGMATVTFNASIYQVQYPGGVLTYVGQPFTDPYLQPTDEWQLSAIGQNYTVVGVTTVTSAPLVNNPASPNVVTAYFANSQSVNGVTTITGNQSYTMYVNSTLASSAGPASSGIGFTVSASIGNVSETSSNTGSTGSTELTYTAPNVTVLTEVTLTITTPQKTNTQTFYIVPEKVVTTTHVSTIYKNTTLYSNVTEVPAYAWALIGVFLVLFVVTAAIAAIEYRKAKSKGNSADQKPPGST